MSKSITEAEVRDLVEAWFQAVHDKRPLAEQQAYFAPGVGIDTWTGVTLSLEQQIAIHEGLTDESHVINSLTLEPLSDGRVRAIGDVTWQATKLGGDRGRIVADAGEDWTIDRGPDGRCRFARYLTSSVRYKPGSAELEL